MGKSSGNSPVPRIPAVTLAFAFVLLLSGCGVFFATPEGRTKREARRLSSAMSVENYAKAAMFFDKEFVWIRHDGKGFKGKAAFDGFLAEIKELRGKRAFYITPGKIKVQDDNNLLMEAHFRQETTDGMIGIGNLMWNATVKWVKRDKHWRIIGIKETTPREMKISK